MALTNTTIANGAALQVFPPTGGDGGLPTSSYSVLGVGTLTANGATQVTVADAGVTANSIIMFTLKTVGGTVSPNALNVITITPGTGFTAAGTASDTSVYNYLRIG
jgi:hypothetical protein